MEKDVEKDDHRISEHDVKGKKKKIPVCCCVASILGVLLLCAVAAIIGLAVGIKAEQGKRTSNPTTGAKYNTCTTPACVELGNQILANLDESVDPCDDFNKFACNRFLEEAIIPYDSSTIGTIETLSNINIERFRTILSSGKNRSVKGIAKAVTYYQSCMNTDAIEREALPSLIELLSELGGWPLVGLDKVTEWDINDPRGFLLELLYGSDAFFGLSIYPDPSNSSRNILLVVQGGLTVPSREAYQEPILSFLKSFMTSVLAKINSSVPQDEYSSAIDRVLDFEAALANITDFSRKPAVDKFNLTTYEMLSEWMPAFDWLENLRFYAKMGNFEFNESSPVNILAPSEYLINLNDLINNTDTVVLENYAKWHLVSRLIPYLNKELSGFYYSFTEKLTGISESPRYKTCVGQVQQQLSLALARAFTDKYLTPGARSNLTVILKELKNAVKEQITSKEWLDEPTKKRALDKADKIIEFLAYPDVILNTSALNYFYSTLNLSDENSFFQNHINTARFNSLWLIGGLARVNNRSVWNIGLPFSPTVVNAIYFPSGNQIYIFEGVLDTPIFKTYWPDYFKFGTIGFLVGHEYFHGFDNSGRRFNQLGNVENWWSDSSVKQFNKNANCLVAQYDNYTLPGNSLLHVNGTLTLGENIADNGALIASYRAYKSRLNKTEEVEQILPGLKYSPEQLFFIGAAQSWCQLTTPESYRALLANPHTPGSLRALGFLSNSREFAAAFDCPATARMNPENKCAVW